MFGDPPGFPGVSGGLTDIYKAERDGDSAISSPSVFGTCSEHIGLPRSKKIAEVTRRATGLPGFVRFRR